MARSSSTTTKDHDEIRSWAEERDAHPTVVDSKSDEGGGILRLDFEGNGDDPGLKHISWDEFFEIFDDRELTFLYQEKTKDGKPSRFNKFIRDTESHDGSDTDDDE